MNVLNYVIKYIPTSFKTLLLTYFLSIAQLSSRYIKNALSSEKMCLFTNVIFSEYVFVLLPWGLFCI